MGRGVFHRGTSRDSRLSGPDPERRSYTSFVTFDDPDGNNWLVQEVTQRLPGRVSAGTATFTSSTDLAAALRRAAAAHGEHEKRTGQHDAGWADWYAEYIVREQTGQQLPS
jgi:ABC-type sugar transport system substrate-binding protein